jgi:uncharacterized OsmC-like protein
VIHTSLLDDGLPRSVLRNIVPGVGPGMRRVNVSTDDIKSSIEGAIGYLSEHPEECRYTDSAATAAIDGLSCKVTDPDGREVATDMPAAVGGGNAMPSPGWLMRAALASCDATLIAMRAAQEGVTLSDLQVSVDSESDDRGLLGMDDSVPAGPFSARVRVRIAAQDVPAERLREIVEWAHTHSPVGDAMQRGVPTTVEVDAS